MNNLPAMTKEKRQALIDRANAGIKLGEELSARHEKVRDSDVYQNGVMLYRIALAALNAEPNWWVNDTIFGLLIEKEQPEHDPLAAPWQPAFATPPAPVLRVPDELKVKNGSHQYHIDYAEGWADCIDEVKRLNAQPSPPEASNEQ